MLYLPQPKHSLPNLQFSAISYNPARQKQTGVAKMESSLDSDGQPGGHHVNQHEIAMPSTVLGAFIRWNPDSVSFENTRDPQGDFVAYYDLPYGVAYIARGHPCALATLAAQMAALPANDPKVCQRSIQSPIITTDALTGPRSFAGTRTIVRRRPRALAKQAAQMATQYANDPAARQLVVTIPDPLISTTCSNLDRAGLPSDPDTATMFRREISSMIDTLGSIMGEPESQ
jgi:hypothetical protein